MFFPVVIHIVIHRYLRDFQAWLHGDARFELAAVGRKIGLHVTHIGVRGEQPVRQLVVGR
jgi:hypothetical protein